VPLVPGGIGWSLNVSSVGVGSSCPLMPATLSLYVKNREKNTQIESKGVRKKREDGKGYM